MPTTDDEIQEKYLERAIRELNGLTHRLQECSHCPRGNLMPVLGSGHPQADIMLLKYAPDGGGDRGGRRLLRPLRQRADEELQAARDRPARRLRDAVRQVPGLRPGAGRGRVRRAGGRGDRDRRAALHRGHGRARARDAQRARGAALARARAEAGRDAEPDPDPSRRSTCPTSTNRSTPRSRSASSGAPSARSATGTRTSRRTERPRSARRSPRSSPSAPALAASAPARRAPRRPRRPVDLDRVAVGVVDPGDEDLGQLERGRRRPSSGSVRRPGRVDEVEAPRRGSKPKLRGVPATARG